MTTLDAGRVFNALFRRTGNSARSISAEAVPGTAAGRSGQSARVCPATATLMVRGLRA